jgi:hypothetical protein
MSIRPPPKLPPAASVLVSDIEAEPLARQGARGRCNQLRRWRTGRIAGRYGMAQLQREPVSSPRRPGQDGGTTMGHGRLRLRACARILAVAGTLATVGAAAPAPASAAFGDHVLRPGDHGREVRVLQRWLTLTGFPVAVDGHFGRRTRVAVRRYERANGQRVDGWVSPEQARGLRTRAYAARAVTAPPPAPAAAAAVPPPAPLFTPTPAAVIAPDGLTAMVPAAAPPQVRDAIVSANRIVGKPYRWGGGHARVEDDAYDCSGAVSYALMGSGLLRGPLDSTALKRFGEAGEGTWISVFANTEHTYVVIAGLRLDTSGTGGSGPRWHAEARSASGYAARHPAGL